MRTSFTIRGEPEAKAKGQTLVLGQPLQRLQHPLILLVLLRPLRGAGRSRLQRAEEICPSA